MENENNQLPPQEGQPQQQENPAPQQMQQEPAPAQEGSPEEMPAQEKKSIGPVIGTIIIIAVIVIGGLYLYGERVVKEEQLDMTPEEILSEEDPALEELQELGTSDEISDLEADLDATDLDDLDEELENLDLEFEL